MKENLSRRARTSREVMRLLQSRSDRRQRTAAHERGFAVERDAPNIDAASDYPEIVFDDYHEVLLSNKPEGQMVLFDKATLEDKP